MSGSERNSPGSAPDRDLPVVLLVEDVADVLRLSRAHVRRLLGRGRLPGKRFGRRWLVPLGEFRALIEAPRRPDIHGESGDGR